MDETTPEQDLRKQPRAKLSLVTKLRSASRFEFAQERTEDVSLGGMFIVCDTPEAPGTLLKLECEIGEGKEPIRGVAVVKWLRKTPIDGFPAGMGVKFIKLEGDGSQALEALLDEAARSPEVRLDLVSSKQGEVSLPPGEATSEAPAATAVASSAPAAASSSAPPAASPAASEPTTAQPQPAADAPVAGRESSPSEVSPPVSRPVQAEGGEGSSMMPILIGVGVLAVIIWVVLSMRGGSDEAPAAESPSSAEEAEAEPAPPSAEVEAPAEEGLPALAADEAQPSAAEGEGDTPGQEPAEAVPADVAAAEPAEPAEAPEAESEATAEGAAEAAPGEQGSATAEPTARADVPAAGQPTEWVLDIVTTPPGAQVMLGEQRITAPGHFSLPTVDGPLRVYADKRGFRPTAATIEPDAFEREGSIARKRIYLRLHAEGE